MRLEFEDDIEIEVSPNGRRPLVAVYRAGELLDRAALDLSDPLQRERWALHLQERHQAPWLDILRDVDLALAERLAEDGEVCGFVGDPLPFSTPFPLGALPEAVREFVQAGVEALDCPPDFVATPLLALAAGVAGNRFELRLTAAWRERPILWTAVVGAPGTAKSPALELALSPVLKLQEEAREEWQQALQAFEAELAQARKEGGRLPERPELEHFTTTDATLEAIARILGHRRSVTPGLCLVRDELVSWVRSYDAYHPRGERQVWMSLWAGMAVKVDRATKDPAFIPRPAISVTGGIQPQLLPRLEEEAGLADGFIERFLYAYPATTPMRLRRDVPRLPDLAPLLGELREAPEGEVALSEGAWEELERWHEGNRWPRWRRGGWRRGCWPSSPAISAAWRWSSISSATPRPRPAIPSRGRRCGGPSSWRAISSPTPGGSSSTSPRGPPPGSWSLSCAPTEGRRRRGLSGTT